MTTIDGQATRPTLDDVLPTLLLAFGADPGIRWLFPRADRFHAAFGELVRLAGGGQAATVDVIHGGAGVAVWSPPGTATDDEAYFELFTRYVDPTRQADVFAWGAQVGAHHPAEAHWYLVALGVDPHLQGQGLGSALLRRGLERCDRDGLPAYLESGNPRNRSVYERHGFEILGEILVADAPPVWPMLRRPKG
jgi:ribosomal protein S18 acetylase RimI-like enzyme